MKVTVRVKRSKEFLTKLRLETGENVAEVIDCPVEVAELSVASRSILLKAGNGAYPSYYTGGYGSDYTMTPNTWYGSVPPTIDADKPSTEEIDREIVASAAEIDRRRIKYLVDQEIAEVAAKQKAAKWAALPLSSRADLGGIARCGPFDCGENYDGPLSSSGSAIYDLDQLKKYEPDAVREAGEESFRLRQIAEGQEAIKDRKILADFLSSVPQDALRGTLKSLACDGSAIEALRAKVEEASPVQIFEEIGDE